jgi:hypothetical protein
MVWSSSKNNTVVICSIQWSLHPPATEFHPITCRVCSSIGSNNWVVRICTIRKPQRTALSEQGSSSMGLTIDHNRRRKTLNLRTRAAARKTFSRKNVPTSGVSKTTGSQLRIQLIQPWNLITTLAILPIELRCTTKPSSLEKTLRTWLIWLRRSTMLQT